MSTCTYQEQDRDSDDEKAAGGDDAAEISCTVDENDLNETEEDGKGDAAVEPGRRTILKKETKELGFKDGDATTERESGDGKVCSC